MNIILLGVQASGKGTQALLLAKKLGISHISTGDIFRTGVKKGDDIGKMLKKYLDKGSLVPDKITNQAIKQRLGAKDAKGGFILDGYPRTIAQAKFLDKIIKIDKVFEINISDKEAVHRINNRRSCVCGKTYNLMYNPPKKEGVCDLCGKKLFIRDDDKPRAIKERLNLYHKKTEPLLKYYENKKILEVVSGERPIEVIGRDIKKRLKK